MAKARAIAVIFVLALLLSAIGPGYVMAAVPNTPTNDSPADTTVDISLSPTLRSLAFSDPDMGSTHAASQWQISDVSGNYTTPLFDSGIDGSNLITIAIPDGYLTYSATYYWRVRHQDDTGWWSGWSAETSFTTIPAGTMPHQPSNVSPAQGTSDIVLNTPLVSSGFATLNGIGTHAGSQWQIAASAAGFEGPLYDSGVVAGSTQMTAPAGLLDYETLYYWRVRHQDNYGNWSEWSDPTSFTTIANRPPYQPGNEAPADGAANVGFAPMLKASAFSDPDEGDQHAGSQWQITTTSGNYATPVFDSGVDTKKLTQIIVPADTLAADTTYYWHVRYYDEYNNASGWSTETSFHTMALTAPVAAFQSADNITEVLALKEAVVFEDTSLGYVSSWEWDFGDGTTEAWSIYDYPRERTVTHIYSDGGAYTVSLTVTNDVGTDNVTRTDYIYVLAAPQASFVGVPDGLSVKFTDTSSGEVTKWTWDFGDGSPLKVYDAANPLPAGGVTHTYDKGGNYVVTLDVAGPLGANIGNRTIAVEGGEGWFAWWMVAAIAGLVVAAGGVVYLMRRREKKAAA